MKKLIVLALSVVLTPISAHAECSSELKKAVTAKVPDAQFYCGAWVKDDENAPGGIPAVIAVKNAGGAISALYAYQMMGTVHGPTSYTASGTSADFGWSFSDAKFNFTGSGDVLHGKLETSKFKEVGKFVRFNAAK